MNNKLRDFITIFLLQLVITLPFYTTSVYATINSVSVKGSDGVNGYARADDFLDFVVLASLSNETVTNNKVVLGSNIKFGTCTASISNGSECTLRFPGSGTQPFEAKSIPFTINLFRSDNTLDDSKSGNVTIDNKAPQVKLTAQSKFSSPQNVVVNYDVTDFACDDPSCANKCVGIKSIEFFTADGAFRQTVEPTTNDCNIKSNISIDPGVFNNGKNSLFAKATDNFNQVSAETSVTFNVNTLGQAIITDSFAIIRKGIELSTFSNNNVPVVVAVNISGSDLNLNSVIADLSALNPSQNLKNAKASCIAAGNGLSACTWNINLNPVQSGLKTITINASDNFGNKATATIIRQLSLDDKGPLVLSLSTNAAANGFSLAKSKGNKVTATFDEATGLSANDVLLHVNGNRIAATSCSKDINWNCQWDNVDFGSSSSKISIESDTTDVLQNAVVEDSSLDVIVDTQAPVLNSINISSVGGLTQAFAGIFKIGDKIAVVANLTEDNDVFAVADFSKFVSGASRIAGSCERIQADQHTCTWLTDSVNLQNSDIVTFNFSDNAGNTLIVTKSLKTFGVETAAVPDLWSNTVACSPSAIDRSLGPLINQRVFCQVSLTPKISTKPVSTVFIGPATCSGDTSVVQSVDTFNTETGSTSPVIKITLKKDDFKINNANLKCSLNIFSKIGGSTTITQNPEIENAEISIQFSNLPLGELSDEVKRKIQDAKDDAEGILDIIGTLNKLVYYAKKICQIFGVIYNILAIYYTITVLWAGNFDAECTVLAPTIFGGLAVCPILFSAKTNSCFGEQTARETAQKGFSLTGNKFCKFVNCQWAPWILGDWQNFLKEKINQLPGANYLPGTTPSYSFGGEGKQTIPNGIQGGLASYMDPQHNLIVATVFVCLPGIIYGLDKYRQIKCLYADCLQNAVGNEGLPVTACEDQKAYATCKYVTGELFALIPYTAVLDHFMRIIKNALSNPFSALGAGISIFCWATCPAPPPTSTAAYTVCEGAKLFSTFGEVIGNVKDIIDTGFTIRTDYCARLEEQEKPATPTAPKTPVTEKTSSGSGATPTKK